MKPERFTALVFVAVIAFFMVLAPTSLVINKVDKMIEKAKKVNIDWEKLYPFAENISHISTEESKSLYEYIKEGLKSYTSDALLGYTKIVEASKRYEDVAGWNMAPVFDYNAVVKLKDGYFTSYKMSLDVAPDAASVKEFADFCAGKGIDFMYINFPTKICVSEDRDIAGKLDFANQNADRFLALLRNSGVRCYDFRKTLHEDGMKHHESFFVTDHHWKPETGLWAAGHILRILRDDLGWNVNPEILSPENFEYVVYPEWFLGSQGKKVTLVRAKPDDLTVIYPKFRTDFHVEMPSVKVNVSGDITGFYDLEQVKEKDFYKLNNYCVYTYGDQPLIRSCNNSMINSKRLLVIKDSFSECVVPFLALGFQYVDVIDLRIFTGSLRTFIDMTKPDAVIVEYHATIPGITVKPTATKTNKKFYDFR
ncbi:MAG: hypothetical protein IJ697_01895 [Synergistaceae bacterium]|nr:hypothetical protein [Synergistaceae bacterium]